MRSKRLFAPLSLGLSLTLLLSTAAEAMQIFVRLPNNHRLTLEVENGDTIENVKTQVQDRIQLAPDKQQLFFGSTLVEDGRTLSDYNIHQEDVLNLVLPRFGNCVLIGDPCLPGDIGPGGGKVFITPSTDGNSTGRYFEAAEPIESVTKFCRDTELFIPSASDLTIGAGKTNTEAFVQAGCDPDSAIEIATHHSANGFNDWFVPSDVETVALVDNKVALGLDSYQVAHSSSNSDEYGPIYQITQGFDGYGAGYRQVYDFQQTQVLVLVREFSLTPAIPVEYPAPVQTDLIAPLVNAGSTSGSTATSSTPEVKAEGTITLNGIFTRKIQNIWVDNIKLDSSSWVQTDTSLTITLPAHSGGKARIEIYNGAVPVPAPITVNYIDMNVRPAPLAPITECVKPGRTYKPRASACLPGYTPVRG